MSSSGSSTCAKNSTSGQGILVSNPNRQRNLLNNIVGGELVMYLNLIEKYQVLHPKYYFSSRAILQKSYGPLKKNVIGLPINHKIYLVQQVMTQSPKKKNLVLQILQKICSQSHGLSHSIHFSKIFFFFYSYTAKKLRAPQKKCNWPPN